MTGAQLHDYVARRLGEKGLTVEPSREGDIYDALTEGRDWIAQTFALAAPVVVQTPVTLEVDGGDDRVYTVPAATKDPLRCVSLEQTETTEPLTPSLNLNQGGGDYRWETTRQLRLADDFEPAGNLRGFFVLQAGDIAAGTTEPQVGLPVPCHRAIGKAAVVLLLTQDEESDARVALTLLQAELDRLERIYGEYDLNPGALREALLASAGALYGDLI